MKLVIQRRSSGFDWTDSVLNNYGEDGKVIPFTSVKALLKIVNMKNIDSGINLPDREYRIVEREEEVIVHLKDTQIL